MSTASFTYPNISRDRRTPTIGLITILIIASVVLIAGAILVIVSSPTWDVYPVDLIPVAGTSPNSLPVAVPVPTPPTAAFQSSPSETAALSASEIRQSVVAVPLPTP